jgi:hypothetical protein
VGDSLEPQRRGCLPDHPSSLHPRLLHTLPRSFLDVTFRPLDILVELLHQDILHCFISVHRLPHDKCVRTNERTGKGMEVWDVVPRRSCSTGDPSQCHLSERSSVQTGGGRQTNSQQKFCMMRLISIPLIDPLDIFHNPRISRRTTTASSPPSNHRPDCHRFLLPRLPWLVSRLLHPKLDLTCGRPQGWLR